MLDEIDIYRAANLLIKQHGDEAAIFAARQADACLEQGALAADQSVNRDPLPLARCK